MKALIFTYCKDCSKRHTDEYPISMWAVDENGENGSYITETDDYFYCGAGVPCRRKGGGPMSSHNKKVRNGRGTNLIIDDDSYIRIGKHGEDVAVRGNGKVFFFDKWADLISTIEKCPQDNICKTAAITKDRRIGSGRQQKVRQAH